MENNDIKYFKKVFKTPKSELNKIRKEFETSKDASSTIDPSKLKDFQEMSDQVFAFFEEITGKKVNRDVMIGNLAYYFDEGFEPEDCKDFIRKSIHNDWYQENPEMLSIARLFPIKDQDRINATWDQLAHYQALRKKILNPLLENICIRLPCGHTMLKSDKYCKDCVIAGDLIEIAKSPYSPFIPKDLEEFAFEFRRHGDETFPEYQTRTMGLFKKLNKDIKDSIQSETKSPSSASV